MSWSKAVSKAKQLLRQSDISKPPVDVERLARLEGLRVVEEQLESEISGMLYREGGHAVIIINQNDAPVRKRFSIAHELGHYHLHASSSVFVDRRVRFRDSTSSQGTIKEEIEANNFAAELLMPEIYVLQEAVRLRERRRAPLSDEELIEELAKIFQVSRQAMEVRLANLGELGTY